MTHTPSHLPPDDPRESDQIGGGWSDDMSSPGPTLDERTIAILEGVESDQPWLMKPAWARAGASLNPQQGHKDMNAALMEEFPGLTAQEAGAYVAAYEQRKRPPSIFQTMGKIETLPKYKVTRQGLGGTIGGTKEYETDLVLTEEGEFKHVPLAERTGGGYMRIGPPKKKVIRMAGGGIAQKQTKFDASRHVGIGRSALRV